MCCFSLIDYRKLKITDLAFALDGSRKLTVQEFSRLKSFVKTVIQDYDVSESGTHVAVIEYSDAARVAISFKDTKDLDSFKQAIDRVRPSRGKIASVNEALKLAREELFSPIGGGRPGIAKVKFGFSGTHHTSISGYKMSVQNSNAFCRKMVCLVQLVVEVCEISTSADVLVLIKKYYHVTHRQKYFQGVRCDESRTIKLFFLNQHLVHSIIP